MDNASAGKLRVALVGLQFGGAFPEIYAQPPDVAEIAICDSDPAVLNAFGDKYGFARRFASVDAVLAAGDILKPRSFKPIKKFYPPR